MITIYKCLWLFYVDPVDIPSVRVIEATISIIISLTSIEVIEKPSYRVRDYCKNNSSKLSR